MTSFSDAKGRKVVSITTAATVGKVSDYIIDPHAIQVAALILKKTGGEEDILPWTHIAGFGDDAVTVKADTAIITGNARITELADKSHAMHGKRVLDTDGQELGEVKDIDFDPATGTLDALVLKTSKVAGSRLLAVGSYAVIVGT
jgi:sporulation protein YlmC with PRC-barrel domain